MSANLPPPPDWRLDLARKAIRIAIRQNDQGKRESAARSLAYAADMLLKSDSERNGRATRCDS